MSSEHWIGTERSRCASAKPPPVPEPSVNACNASPGAGRCFVIVRRMSRVVSFSTARLGLTGSSDFVFLVVTAIGHLLPIGARSCAEGATRRSPAVHRCTVRDAGWPWVDRRWTRGCQTPYLSGGKGGPGMAKDIQDRVGQVLGSDTARQILGTAVDEALKGFG